MRTIKFRLRNQDTKKIVGYEEFIENSGWKYQHVEEKEHYNWRSGVMDSVWIREQFTDLKDKNGKEIYEGDIIKDKNHHYARKVIFENGVFIVRVFQESHTPLYEYLNQFDVEIIGNIYENPELIK